MDGFSPALFPFPPLQISDEELHAFHLSDRKLYQILIHDLEREPYESMNIMGFWIWLDKKVCFKVNLILILLDLPLNLVNEVADETVVCLLSCLFRNMPFSESIYELAILPNLAYPNLSSKKLSLQDFHQNRDCVIFNVNKIVKDICSRVFKDLMLKKAQNYGINNNMFKDKGKVVLENNQIQNLSYNGFPVLYQPGVGMAFSRENSVMNMIHEREHSSSTDFSVTEKLVLPVNNMLSHVCKKDYDNLLSDERTIFITFSKGHPVPEAEIKYFFTWYVHYTLFSKVFFFFEMTT